MHLIPFLCWFGFLCRARSLLQSGGHIKPLGLEGAAIRAVPLRDTTGAKQLSSRGGVSRFGQGGHTAALPSPLPARLGSSLAFTRRFRSTRLNSEFLRDHLGPFTPSQGGYRGQPCDSEVYFGSRRDSLWPGIWPTRSHELGCGGEMSQSQNTPPGTFSSKKWAVNWYVG